MDSKDTFGATKIYNLLNGISFFEIFTPDELDKLMEIGEWLKLASGKRIITKGDFDNYIYILVQGQVEIILDGKILAVLNAGDIFGEFGLTGAQRTADVETKTECMLMSFNGDRLNILPPNVQVKFLKRVVHIMCCHLQQLNRSLWFRTPTKNI